VFFVVTVRELRFT